VIATRNENDLHVCRLEYAKNVYNYIIYAYMPYLNAQQLTKKNIEEILPTKTLRHNVHSVSRKKNHIPTKSLRRNVCS